MSFAKLGDVAQYLRGINFKPDDVVPVGTAETVACMRTRNIQESLDCSDVWGVAETFVRRPEQILRVGDILVSSANSWNLVGKCCWIPELPWKSTFGGFVSALRVNPKKVDPRFLYWWFSSDRTQALLRSFGRKTTSISNLSAEQCLNLDVPLPPLPEQRRIAAILDQADVLRAKRREALAQLDRLTQSIFIEMFGDERIQAGRWPVVKFEEIVSESRIGLVRGSQELDESNPYPYLRMNAITREGDLRLEGALLAQATDEEVSVYRLQRGDFLFNTRNSRELVGKTALFRSDELYLFNNNLMRVRFTDATSPEYVLAAFKTQFIQGELEVRKSGTTNVYAVYFKDLRTLPVPLPPIQLQEIFANRVHAIEVLKTSHMTALAELDELFASLQYRAFRGEL